MNNAGTHLLIEFPSSHVPRYTEELLYDIAMKGITPTIVHPERNRDLVKYSTMLYEFVKKGALIQDRLLCKGNGNNSELIWL